MARFGGSEFIGFSVPLVFNGRYFVLESGKEDLISVFIDYDGQPMFEILKNKPVENQITEVSSNSTGVITVSDKNSGKFLYKIRPSSETSITFGKLDGDEFSVQIMDKHIKVGTNTITNCTFNGSMAGIVINQDGGFGIGAAIPPIVLKWLASR